MTTKKFTPKHKTNKTKGSLVKVVVSNDTGKWLTPPAAAAFAIDAAAIFPVIDFEIETQETGPFAWSWSISWDAKTSSLRESAKRGPTLRKFTDKGSHSSNEKKWRTDLSKVIGGKLRVEVRAGNEKFVRTVLVKGTNPSAVGVRALLATLPDCDGFDKLLEQESHFKHFIEADGQPVVAFDRGYGLTQMTNPAPTYEQAWNWKDNAKGGAALYQQKQASAKTYLSQQGRTYTSDQLRLETWSRWNGGSHHVWDAKAKVWVRNDDLLCDPATGNIGWYMTDPDNKDKTADELHKRDKSSYGNPKRNKGTSNMWRYTGVCYADHVNAK